MRSPTDNVRSTVQYYGYSAALVLLLVLLFQLPVFGSLNNVITDQFHGGGAVEVRDNIVIVGIDDESLQQIGAWPWDRHVFAQTLRRLEDSRPGVVGIDVTFLEARAGDSDLSDALSGLSYPVVLSSKIEGDTVLNSIFDGPSVSQGFVNVRTDRDGKVRQFDRGIETHRGCVASFPFALYQSYLRVDDVDPCERGNITVRGKTIPDRGYFVYADRGFPMVSFVDLYEGNIDQSLLKDKAVLIGSTAQDLRSNLLDNFVGIDGQRIPGVEIHGQTLNAFFEERFVRPLSAVVLAFVLIIMTSVLLRGYERTRGTRQDALLFITAIGVSFLLGIFLFDRGLIWPFVTVTVVFVANYLYMLAWKYLKEREEKRFVAQAFSQYMNPQLLRQITEEPALLQLGGEKRNMTVLFSDIRSFTTISEQLSAERLVHMLNDYLDVMSRIILEKNGTIDKFIGDAIMAFWNAPVADAYHEQHAIATALSMLEALDEFNATHTDYPDLAIGIGINTGDMVVGNMGSTKRFDYTVLGDNVNLGARLEGLTKKYGIGLIVSESAMNGASEIDGIIFRLLDEVVVKGKTEPIRLYQPLRSTDANRARIEAYTAAFDAYQQGDFDNAQKVFESLEDDGPSQTMLGRIAQLRDIQEWDGIWTWTEK